MSFTDTFRDFYESLTASTELHAETAAADEEEDSSNDNEGEEKDGGDDEEAEAAGGDGDGEEEEEEEEEEEPEDIKPKLEEDCAKSAQCVGLKHHYHECAERVQMSHEDPDFKGPHEDCVEEFFHLQHCATQCAAPKLFKTLK